MPKVAETIDFSVVVNLIIMTFVQLGFSYLWGLINTLQMILYLPLLKVGLPKNVKLFYSILLPLANLDLIPPQYSTELIFDISSDEDHPYSPVLEEMGFETHNVILNMGSLYVYFMLLLLALSVMGVLKLFKIYFPGDMKYIKPYRKLKKIIFWGSFIILFMEGYLEIFISGYLNLLTRISYTKSDKFSYVISYTVLFVQIVILPGAFIYMLTRPNHVLKEKEVKLRIGYLYEGLKLDSKICVCYNFV